MTSAVVLSILESSQVGEARRLAVTLARQIGFNETERGKIGIIVTEAANNLVRHAQEGLLILQAISKHNRLGIEILALDKGPGIQNISECLRDGFSSTGTSGNGLGAIRRLSTLFEIYSVPELGTALLSQLWTGLSTNPKEKLELGAIGVPIADESVSGDAWASCQSIDRSVLLVVDGLGHGAMAAAAAEAAVRVFREQVHLSPKAIIEVAHAALQRTRGAALAIAEINFAQQTVRFAGIGNISGTVFSITGTSRMVSHNGTVGHEVRKIQEFTYPWHPTGILIMHSDGLSSRWQLDRYPGLAAKHCSLIAGVLYRDCKRHRDDVTVLVAREETASC